MNGQENIDVVWIVKLPAEYKKFFEHDAEQVGDTTHGAGARQVRKVLKCIVEGDRRYKQLLDLAYELQSDMVFQDENAFDTDAVKRTANKWLEKSSDIIAEVER